MKTFYKLLVYALIAGTTNNFVWFALTFWAYLETRSVISTAFVGGFYGLATAASGFWLGAIVDHNKKKKVLLGSSLFTLAVFALGLLIYQVIPPENFKSVASPVLWFFAFALMIGVISGNVMNIAIPTLITHLVKEGRDKANGLFGTVFGISFAITSVASGLVLGFLGMFWVLVLAVCFTGLAAAYIFFLEIPEKKIIHAKQSRPQKIDIKGTIKVVSGVSGLFALIFFTTFNNLLGGVFMALMDAYGLSLVSVQAWGITWGILSFGFIIGGGLIIAKKGLGKNPLKTLFLANLAIWIACIIFPIQASIVLTFLGAMVWMILFPFIEATEQTIIQQVVPPERQGRVFGFAQSIEQSATPLTAFLIGPVAQIFFIPFMTTGAGVALIGEWFGTGVGRGIGLVFILAGLIGLSVTLIAMRSKPYMLLAKRYQK